MQKLDNAVWRHATGAAAWICTLAAVVAPAGCERGSSGGAAKSNKGGGNPTEFVDPPPTPPEHTIATGLREKYPEVTAFVDQFLATCLVGDYTRYRTLVSRRQTPESKERFTAIYHAIESVQVESIERVDQEIPALPAPSYLVISAVTVRKEATKGKGHGGLNRRIAIIVFQESGEWRMLPAPTDFQPLPEGHGPTTTAPMATSEPARPDFPWEEAGDG